MMVLSAAGWQTIAAQNPISTPPVPSPAPKLPASPVPNSEKSQIAEVSRERREQAYAKLLEGQRYLWNSNKPRAQSGAGGNARLAKQALQKAVELNPALAEGYTALAELAIVAPPSDVDEAILLASIATRIEPKNFGGRRILARLYTFKSRLNNGVLDQNYAQKAIAEWREVVKLDPRNAEGWAFLSELYDKTNKSDQRIEALRNWISSAAPIETQFYRRVMGGQENLSPESASLKLAAALNKVGKTKEAVEILSQVVADEPENAEAIELLRASLETAGGESALIAAESLKQAVYANPGNTALIALLAQVQARGGKTDEAAKTLRDSSAKLIETDKAAAANLQITLGDLFSDAKRVDEAVAAYQNALTTRGIGSMEPANDEERRFAIAVFDKMIRVYKNANRPNDVKAVIERARQLLGKDDLFADRQMISLQRENGSKADALETARAARSRFPEDYSLLSLEATLLTENGKVDEAVALIKNLIEKKKVKSLNGDGISTIGDQSVVVSVPMYDEFSNYLFISNLYTQAGRGKEALEAVNKAMSVAQSEERRQIAELTLATVQQMSGDTRGAETTLRGILRQMPDNPIALNNLGYFLLERNEKPAEAFELIRKAVATDPTNPSYLDSLGWAYFKLGKFAEAEKYLQQALRLDAGSTTIHEHLGDVYQKQNRMSDARAAWQKALNLASDAADSKRLRYKLNLKLQ